MIIDWHAHVYPPEVAKERRWGGTTPLTITCLPGSITIPGFPLTR